MYAHREELAHAVSHGFGLIASTIALGLMVSSTWARGETRHVVACSIFGITLVLVYASSTLYHSWREPRTKRLLQLFDYIAIYFLIAGTYTPFMALGMWNSGGFELLCVVWSLALAGMLMELVRESETRRTSVALYLLMGWLMVFALEPLHASVEPIGIQLLVLGCLTYAFGTVFYWWDRLPYNHVVWHGFVLAGSGIHFMSIWKFVLP